MKSKILTQYATHAHMIADTFRAAFANEKLGEHTIEMTAPAGSTGGGLRALQHVTLKVPAGLALVVGTVNAGEKRADLRSYLEVKKTHEDRFAQPLDFDEASYGAFLEKAGSVLAAFGLTVNVAERTVIADVDASPVAPARSKLPFVVGALVFAALVCAFAVRALGLHM